MALRFENLDNISQIIDNKTLRINDDGVLEVNNPRIKYVNFSNYDGDVNQLFPFYNRPNGASDPVVATAVYELSKFQSADQDFDPNLIRWVVVQRQVVKAGFDGTGGTGFNGAYCFMPNNFEISNEDLAIFASAQVGSFQGTYNVPINPLQPTLAFGLAVSDTTDGSQVVLRVQGAIIEIS